MPLELEVPEGAELIESSEALRVRGTARHLMEFAGDLRAFSVLFSGDSVIFCRWRLVISDSPSVREFTVAMPQAAWRVCASKFMEVATGREEPCFDFGDCGYLVPPPIPDIGVELIGEPISDVPLEEVRSVRLSHSL